MFKIGDIVVDSFLSDFSNKAKYKVVAITAHTNMNLFSIKLIKKGDGSGNHDIGYVWCDVPSEMLALDKTATTVVFKHHPLTDFFKNKA